MGRMATPLEIRHESLLAIFILNQMQDFRDGKIQRIWNNKEVGDYFGVSRECVRQLVNQSLFPDEITERNSMPTTVKILEVQEVEIMRFLKIEWELFWAEKLDRLADAETLVEIFGFDIDQIYGLLSQLDSKFMHRRRIMIINQSRGNCLRIRAFVNLINFEFKCFTTDSNFRLTSDNQISHKLGIEMSSYQNWLKIFFEPEFIKERRVILKSQNGRCHNNTYPDLTLDLYSIVSELLMLKKNNSETKLLNIAELANILGCTQTTIGNRLRAPLPEKPTKQQIQIHHDFSLYLELLDQQNRKIFSERIKKYRHLRCQKNLTTTP